jgi:hypothetical protein
MGSARIARAPLPPVDARNRIAGAAMNAICFIVAGVVRTALPGSEFTLAWDHSVEKTRWEERYRSSGGALVLVAASVQALGAGMEPPPGAVLSGGAWTWQPNTTHAELRLTRSTCTGDYTACVAGRCGALGDIVGAVGEGELVLVRACDRGSAP